MRGIIITALPTKKGHGKSNIADVSQIIFAYDLLKRNGYSPHIGRTRGKYYFVYRDVSPDDPPEVMGMEEEIPPFE